MKLGVALSGGGVRCTAQLAILDALSKVGIEADVYAGASGGALVASMILAGHSADDILSLVRDLSIYRQLKLKYTLTGILDPATAFKAFTNKLPANFNDLAKPLRIVATDLEQGSCAVFHQGPLPEAVLASCCMPVIFAPVVINNTPYIDAGLVNNLPADTLQDCDTIVGIHTNPIQKNFKNMGIRSIVERSFLLAINGNVAQHKSMCSLYLEPEFLAEYRVFDFNKIKEIYTRSQEWIIPRLSEIKDKLNG